MADKIKEIEEEMNRTQKNKATEHHLGRLKAQLAKLRRELLEDGAKGGPGILGLRSWRRLRGAEVRKRSSVSGRLPVGGKVINA